MAQSFVVKGKVVSKTDGMPLIGASVLQKGTTNGVVTDIDGNYQLQIQGKDAMLRFHTLECSLKSLKSMLKQMF